MGSCFVKAKFQVSCGDAKGVELSFNPVEKKNTFLRVQVEYEL